MYFPERSVKVKPSIAERESATGLLPEALLSNEWSPILVQDTPEELIAETTPAHTRNRNMEQNDWDIVGLFQTDKEKSFSLLVNRHYKLVANICFKFFLDPDQSHDATQEIFLHVFNSLDRVKEGEQPFVHWLCRVTTNHCRNIYRKTRRSARLLDEKQSDIATHGFIGHPADWRVEQKEMVSSVHSAMIKVKPEERITLVLAEMLHYDTAEIASITDTAEHKVRRRLRRAKDKLRKLLTQEKVINHAQSK